MSAPTAIRFVCSSCGYRARIPSKFEGKHIKCPSCKATELVSGDEGAATGQTVAIKRLDSSEKVEGKFRFVCGECGYRARIPVKYVGMAIKCPGCGKAQLAAQTATEEEPTETGDTVQISRLDVTGGKDVDKFRFQCSGCGYRAKLPKRFQDQHIKCPGCGLAQLARALDDNDPITGDTMVLQLVEEVPPPEPAPQPLLETTMDPQELARGRPLPATPAAASEATVPAAQAAPLAPAPASLPMPPAPPAAAPAPLPFLDDVLADEPPAAPPAAEPSVKPATSTSSRRVALPGGKADPRALAKPAAAATPTKSVGEESGFYERTPTGIKLLPEGTADEDPEAGDAPDILPGSGGYAVPPAALAPATPAPALPVAKVHTPAPAQSETAGEVEPFAASSVADAGAGSRPRRTVGRTSGGYPTKDLPATNAASNATTIASSSAEPKPDQQDKPVKPSLRDRAANPPPDSYAPVGPVAVQQQRSGAGLKVLLALLLLALGGAGYGCFWLKQQWDSATKDNEALAQNLKDEQKAHRSTQESLTESLTTAQNDRDAQKLRADGAETEREAVKAELATRDGQLAAEQGAHAETQKAKSALEGTADLLRSELTSHKEQLATRATELEQVTAAQQKLATEVASLKDQLHQAQQAVEAVKVGGSQFKLQVDQAQAALAQAESDLKAATEQRTMAQAELDKLKAAFDAMPEAIRKKYLPAP